MGKNIDVVVVVVVVVIIINLDDVDVGFLPLCCVFAFEGPHGKQLLARVCEVGNNCFKVDYIPVMAGALGLILITSLAVQSLLLPAVIAN